MVGNSTIRRGKPVCSLLTNALAIFALPADKSATASPPRPPRCQDPNIRSNPTWTAEEDFALEDLYKAFGCNWPLVMSSFNSRRRGRFPKKSEWECYKRVLVILEGPVVTPVAVVAPEAMVLDGAVPDAPDRPSSADTKRTYKRKQKGKMNTEREGRLERLLATFEFICRAAKKRENIRHPPGLIF
jgi:hypothetical protein